MNKQDATEGQSAKKQIPIAPNLFVLPSSSNERPYLVGTKCTVCGEVVFPQTSFCCNCTSQNVKAIALSRKGKVWGATIMRRRPALYEGPLPFASGLVELPEEVLIPAVLTGCSLEKPVDIGAEVELTIEVLGQDKEGNDILTYKFKPV